MTNSATLGSFGDVSGSSLMFRNKLINGGFDIWQRGTSQTSNGYGSDDRWQNNHSGSTKTSSQQLFTLGQTAVPNNPKYYSRTVVTSSAGAGNYVYKLQAIESVATLAGQTATLSFWAKADASKNIAVELVQNFGSGGSPTSPVTGIGATTCALTTSWKYFTITISIPSISGSVLGTNYDYLGVNFWFDAGSTFNARTNSLGQQSGTFDIAQVQLESGSAATPFEQRPIHTELNLCQRYCWYFGFYSSYGVLQVNTYPGSNRYALVLPHGNMRQPPTITHNLTDANYVTTAPTTGSQWTFLVQSVGYGTKTGTASFFSYNGVSTSFLDIAGASITNAGLCNLGPTTYILATSEL